jgi:cytoskeletal protein CcmA (bactofilin family)
MWKKGEVEEMSGTSANPASTTPTRSAGGQPQAGRGGSATIGPSITICGDVTGDEDLLIQGRVEGTVTLKQHNVTVGPDGTVRASIHGRTVTIEGDVEGDLRGEEQVVLRNSARHQGNIQAPRVTLEDGAKFRGGIDMGEESSTQAGPAGRKTAPRTEAAPKAKEPGPMKILETTGDSDSQK